MASAALAGEVQGPPGTPGVVFRFGQTDRGTRKRQLSLCLQRFERHEPGPGQIDFITQNPHNQEE
jgi:hypothetical protein